MDIYGYSDMPRMQTQRFLFVVVQERPASY